MASDLERFQNEFSSRMARVRDNLRDLDTAILTLHVQISGFIPRQAA